MTLFLPLSSVDAVFGAVKDEGHSQPCQQLLSGRPHLYMSSHAEQLHHGNPTGWQHVHQSPWPGNDLHILWPQVGVCWPWNCPLSDLWKVCLSVISLVHTYRKESLYCSASLPKLRSFHVIKVKLHSPRSPKNLNEAYQTLKLKCERKTSYEIYTHFRLCNTHMCFLVISLKHLFPKWQSRHLSKDAIWIGIFCISFFYKVSKLYIIKIF